VTKRRRITSLIRTRRRAETGRRQGQSVGGDEVGGKEVGAQRKRDKM